MAERYTILPSASTTPRYEILPEDDGKQFYDDTLLGELGEGIVSGGIGIVEGLAGLGALGVDIVADTDYGDKVTESAEALRDAMGIDPEGFVGKGAELVTQFVVPGIGVAAKVGKAAQAARAARGLANTPMTRAERFALAAKELGVAGLTDAAVSTDNMTTIGDWVDGGVTQTSDLIGLSGREKALARLGNRAKIGTEAALLGGVAQGALMGAGQALTGTARTIGQTEIGQVSAQAVKKKLDDAATGIDNLLYKKMTGMPGSADELGTGRKLLAEAIAFGRYRGYLPQSVSEKRLLVDGVIQEQVGKADKLLKKLDGEMAKVLRDLPEGQGNLDDVSIMNKIDAYLTEPDEAVKRRMLGELPRSLHAPVRKMRSHMTELSQKVLNSNFLQREGYTLPNGQRIADVIEQNINSYMRRRYKIHENAKYKPTAESLTAAKNYFRANKTATEKELTELFQKDVDNTFDEAFLRTNGLEIRGDKVKVIGNVSDPAAALARDGFLRKNSIRARKKLNGGFMATHRLDTGMFMNKDQIPKTLRALLGEVDDPREAYLATVADLAQFSAIDDYYGTVAKLAQNNSGIGKLFRNGANLTKAQKRHLVDDLGYVKLGGEGGSSNVRVMGELSPEDAQTAKALDQSGWGALDGYYVPREVYRNLTNQVLAEGSFGATLLRGTFGVFLKGKAVSQYSKTVLSPITQIRNFTTAVAFALANGNVPVVGRGGSLSDSARLVFSNIASADPTSTAGKFVGNKLLGIGRTAETSADAIYRDLADAQRRGVLGTSAELREIQDSLQKGLGITARTPRSGFEALAGEKIAKGVGAIGKGAKVFEDIYQGSDDFWKYFNYNAEQAKLRKALEGATTEQKLSYLLKQPVNNISRLDGPGGLLQNVEYAEAFNNLRRAEDLDPNTLRTMGIRMPDNDMVEELIKNRAAQIVRDTVPNYNKAGSDAIGFGRKLPLGNFISFPAEIMRTGVNIVRQGLDDMASDIPAIRSRGRNRLLSFVATTTVIPAAALEMGYAISGVSREEMDAYKRSFAPPWEKGSILIPLGKTEDGKIEYINFSTSNPYDTLTRFANRMINEADDAIKQGKSPTETLEDVAFASAYEIVAPFMSEAMFTEAILDVSIRRGQTSTGAKVFTPKEEGSSVGDRFFSSLVHVGDTLLPNLIPVNISGGNVEPSRFLRGVMGSEDGMISNVDKMGRERNFQEEIARQLLGISTQTFDPAQSAAFAGFRLTQAQTAAKSEFNRVADNYNAGPKQLENAFIKANEMKHRTDKEFLQVIEDLRTMGLRDSDIRKIFKKENIGGYKELMRGRFKPFDVSKKNIKDMREVGIYDAYKEVRPRLRAIQEQFKEQTLYPDR
jgi:hypothetical protein